MPFRFMGQGTGTISSFKAVPRNHRGAGVSPYKVFKSVLNQFDPCKAYLLIFMDEDPLQESEIPVLYLMVCNIDSLHYSVSTSNTELHRLLLDCNETEQEIIIRTAKELKATLVSLGI